MYELLVVDDEALSRNTLSTCYPWKDLDFHICGQVNNGEEALEFMKQQTVHVILSDICMPVMNGIALAKTIYERKAQGPLIVFMSAYDNFKYAQEAIKYDVRYYILKPSTFEELTNAFEKIREELDAKHQTKLVIPRYKSPDEIIDKVVAYCEKNYQTASLTDLSALLYLNGSYLSQMIRQKTGRTFSDLLQETRMKQAALLLSDPTIKIYHISDMVGYNSSNNFTRAFKTYYNMTPSEYRQYKVDIYEP